MAATAPAVRSEFRDLKALQSAMADRLALSGLTDKDLKTLRFLPLLAQDVARKHPALPAARAGFLIPYFNLKGKPTDFFRFRYLEYGQQNGFSGLVATPAKFLRYGQQAGTLNELYLPPYIDWMERAKDATKAVIITEGELKSAATTRAGFPTIGLGGVWCFKSGARGMQLLPQFDDFVWSARPVVICFDSDAVNNVNIIAAENALAKALTDRGALPSIARMPALAPGQKTGLDDFLVARGSDALLAEVLDKAQPWPGAEGLFQLNEEVVYVTDPGLVLRLDNMQRLSPRAFWEHAYSARKYTVQVPGANGTMKSVEHKTAKDWIDWPIRATVRKFTYAPGEERITTHGEMNTWRGWGTVAKKGGVEPWHKLLEFLFRGSDAVHRAWFERWLAYPLQHPGTKLYTASVLWGTTQGTGKSLVGYTMFEIYGSNAVEITDRDLTAAYNDWADSRQFVMGDEIAGGDKRGMADRMKSIITQRQVRINAKYVPTYTIPDCVNYYFTSNHPDAFFLEDNDRRFFIHEVASAPLPSEFYKDYATWLYKQGGAAALFHHFLHLDLADFAPTDRAPVTNAKLEMIEDDRSDLAAWVAQARENTDQTLRLGGVALPYKLWTTSELYAIYESTGAPSVNRVTKNGLGRELRRAGFRRTNRGQPVELSDGAQVKLWAIRDRAAMEQLNRKQLKVVYEEERRAKGVKPTGREAKF